MVHIFGKSISVIIIIISLGITLITSLFDNNIYLLFLLSVIIWILVPIRKYWDKISFFLVLFSLFYTTSILLTNKLTSWFSVASYLIAPTAFYRLGNYLIDTYNSEKSRIRVVMLIGVAFLFHMFVLCIVDTLEVGIVNPNRELSSNGLTATLYGLMASYGIGLLSGVFSSKVSIFERIILLIVFLLSLLTVVHLVNRTGVVLALVCLCITVLCRCTLNPTKVLSIVLALGLIVWGISFLELDFVAVLDAYLYRIHNSSHEMNSVGGRTGLWLEALSRVFSHPWGWTSTKYAHNLWLDIARVGGLLPFLSFFFATCIYLRRLKQLIKLRNNVFGLLLITINTSMILSSFVEPVIEGSFLFFSIMMMIWGITNRTVISIRYNTNDRCQQRHRNVLL